MLKKTKLVKILSVLLTVVIFVGSMSTYALADDNSIVLLNENDIVGHQRGGYTLDEIRAMLQQDDIFGQRREYQPDGDVVVHELSSSEMLEVFGSPDDVQLFSDFSYAVRPIVGGGRSCSDSIVLVLLGDGFTAGNGNGQVGDHRNPGAGTFLHSAHDFAETLLNTYPFSLFKDVFKILAVETPSTQQGIRAGTNENPINAPFSGTYFGTYFERPGSSGITMTRLMHALIVSNWASPNAIMTQVILNTTQFGGVAFVPSAAYENRNSLGITARYSGVSQHSGRPSFHHTIIHEMGHSFGGLTDERNIGRADIGRANVALATDRNEELKWGHWLNHDGITRRTANAPTGYMYPSASASCTMQAGGMVRFCRVCSAELTRRMAMISGETFEAGRRPDGTLRPATPNVTAVSQHNRILPYAFHGNRTLQTLTIPASVAEIGDYAFIGATGLRTINNQRRTPPTINDTTFAGLNRGIIEVIVPSGTSLAYANAGWTNFKLVENGVTSVWDELSFVMNDTDASRATPRTVAPIGVPHGARILEFLSANHSGFNATPTRDGHKFDGWYTNANFQTRLTNTTIMPAGKLTLYARWEVLPATGFADVPPSHWAHNYVKTIAEAGIMQGTGNRMFEPEPVINRAAFAAVLGRTDGVVTGNGFPATRYSNEGHRFNDMAGFGWANQYVAWASASSRNIILGTGANTFSPGGDITREQAATLLFRYEAYRLGREPAYNPATLNAFPDQDEVSSWARAGMAWAVENGIIRGRAISGENRLVPRDGVRRAETAAIICRYLER